MVEEDGKENPALQKSKRFPTYPKELVLKAQPKDGNCVFHTLASGLAWVTSGSKNPVKGDEGPDHGTFAQAFGDLREGA